MADFHEENRYFRILPLGELGIAGDFEVSRVRVGIRDALGPPARHPVAVRLHTLAGEPLVTNLTQIAEQRIEVTPDATTDATTTVPPQVDVPFSSALIPSGSTLVVEVFLADGLRRRDDLLGGMGQGDASRAGLRAATPSDGEPGDATPDLHLVVSVFGRER